MHTNQYYQPILPGSTTHKRQKISQVQIPPNSPTPIFHSPTLIRRKKLSPGCISLVPPAHLYHCFLCSGLLCRPLYFCTQPVQKVSVFPPAHQRSRYFSIRCPASIARSRPSLPVFVPLFCLVHCVRCYHLSLSGYSVSNCSIVEALPPEKLNVRELFGTPEIVRFSVPLFVPIFVSFLPFLQPL